MWAANEDGSIDWEGMVRKEEVARLVYTPFLREAGVLMAVASRLWPGRIRAREMEVKGQNLRSLAIQDARNAVGWSHNEVGSLLAEHNDQRRYFPQDEQWGGKSEEAARRLVQGAVYLISHAGYWMEQLDKHAPTHDAKCRERLHEIEDDFELFLESPCGRPPAVPISDEGFACLRRSAILRACYSLAATMETIASSIDPELKAWAERVLGRYYSTGLSWEDMDWELITEPSTEPGKARALWNARVCAFARWAEELYVRFASEPGVPPGEREALLAVMDTALAYTSRGDSWRSYGMREVRMCEEVVSCLVSILFRSEFGSGELFGGSRAELPARQLLIVG